MPVKLHLNGPERAEWAEKSWPVRTSITEQGFTILLRNQLSELPKAGILL